MKLQLKIFADYHQIWLEDKAVQGSDRDFIFKAQHLSDRVWVDRGLIIIFTARNMVTPVEVEVVDTEPILELENWDHVAEASIEMPSGALEICGCGGYDSNVLTLPIGIYRVRMCHAKLSALSEDGLDGEDNYKLLIWAGASILPTVFKRYGCSDNF